MWRRSKSGTPRNSSSARIWRLTADCVRKSSARRAREGQVARGRLEAPRGGPAGAGPGRVLAIPVPHARNAPISFVGPPGAADNAGHGTRSILHALRESDKEAAMELNIRTPPCSTCSPAQIVTLDDAAGTSIRARCGTRLDHRGRRAAATRPGRRRAPRRRDAPAAPWSRRCRRPGSRSATRDEIASLRTMP